ncbi:MAG: hypothetical protein EOO62_20355, partial [Hymenobacter sp.]
MGLRSWCVCSPMGLKTPLLPWSMGPTIHRRPLTMADGSLLIGGSFNAFNGQETPLGRLFDTGAPDPTFLPKIQIEGNIEAIVRQADGSLVLGGNFTEYSGAPVHRIVRLSATGMLDVAYSAATGLLPARVTCLALQPDGKVLAGTDRGLRRLFTTG